MTKKELAEKLNGKSLDYDFDLELEEARQNGLVVVTAASDDLMEFDGAINDEGGCYGGGTVWFNKNGVVDTPTTSDKCIEAVWCDGENRDGLPATWTYKTNIPCERFDIWEDEDIYCEGLIFSIEDLK